MSFDFTPAEPVKGTATGRPSEPNPFDDAVTSIANKKDDKGRPLALSFTETAPGEPEEVAKLVAKFKRLLDAAGTTAGVTVRKSVDLSALGIVKVTFWTIERVTRKKKDLAPE